jgi:acetylglutamate kinase
LKNDVSRILEQLAEAGVGGSAKYIREFEGKTFVIKSGGALVEDAATGAAILDDLALLNRAGVRAIFVHGGSVQADRDMQAAGIEPKRYKGLRITCDRTIEILERCFGALNAEIVAGLRERGVNAAGFSGARGGGLLRAEVLRPDGVDIGNVGDVKSVRADLLDALPPDALPVVSSLGVAADGSALNINADYAATTLALQINAEKLILLTDVPGVLLDRNDPSTLVSTLTCAEARRLIENRTIDFGMIPKIESAVRTVEAGLRKLHIISGAAPHALAREVFTDEGCGTQIVRE